VGEQPLRILIAEDDDRLGKLVEEVLAGDSRFLVVGRATNGDEAVELCEQQTPDIVLMDIGMPGRDGIDATRIIRARDARQHVVIYTGSDEYGDVARADDAGAAGFLHKSALTSPELADALQVLHANYVSGIPDPE
jgi:DNA-binding NarL/FixJ family response regulator